MVKAKKCKRAGTVLKTQGTSKSGKVLAHCRWQKPGEKAVQAKRAKEMPRNANGKFKQLGREVNTSEQDLKDAKVLESGIKRNG